MYRGKETTLQVLNADVDSHSQCSYPGAGRSVPCGTRKDGLDGWKGQRGSPDQNCKEQYASAVWPSRGAPSWRDDLGFTGKECAVHEGGIAPEDRPALLQSLPRRPILR